MPLPQFLVCPKTCFPLGGMAGRSYASDVNAAIARQPQHQRLVYMARESMPFHQRHLSTAGHARAKKKFRSSQR
ncbi:hypothetical protein IF2G_03184 [Cordyceps javanica]|nr:hypothetical protein IF2G_03184 [Cordyceps javanica]